MHVMVHSAVEICQTLKPWTHLGSRCGPCAPSRRQRSGSLHAQLVRARQRGDSCVESRSHRRHRQQRLPVGGRQKLRRVVAHCTHATLVTLTPFAPGNGRARHPRIQGVGTELHTCSYVSAWAASQAKQGLLCHAGSPGRG